MTLAEILALPFKTSPRFIYVTDQGAHYSIPANSTGEAAKPIGQPGLVSVNDAATRKLAATYDSVGGVFAGSTKVTQIDLPGIIWTLVAADVTQDTSWIGQPYTVDPDGDIIVSMELADVTGTVPDRNVLGVSGSQLRLGDGLTTNGNAVFKLPSSFGTSAFTLDLTPAEYRASAKFTYTKPTAPTGIVNVGGGATHIKFLRWDGTFHTVRKAVSGNTSFNAGDWGTAPATPYNTRLPKYGAICPCDSAGAVTGYFTYLSLVNNSITSFDGSGLSSLSYLSLNSNSITNFDGSGLSLLTNLDMEKNNLTSFDGSGLPLLTTLRLSYNNLTSFDGSGLPLLTTLYLNYNDNLTSFDGSGLPLLTTLYLNYNDNLTSFDGSGLSSLTTLFIGNNPNLTSFDGVGLSSLNILAIQNNNLNSFDGVGLSSLNILSIEGNNLTSFDGVGLSSLTGLAIQNNNLTSFDGSGLPLLTALYIHDNNLTSFDGSGLSSLNTLDIYNNPNLVSIMMDGQNLSNDDNSFSNCALDASALNNLYISLGSTTTGIIYVTGNPGTTGDDPTIATSKGYIIIES